MNYHLRRRFAGILLLLPVLVMIVYMKFFVLPIFTHPLVAIKNEQQYSLLVGGVLFGMGLLCAALLYSGKTTTVAHGSAHFATREELKTYGTLAIHPRKVQQQVTKALTVGELPPSNMHLGLYLKS